MANMVVCATLWLGKSQLAAPVEARLNIARYNAGVNTTASNVDPPTPPASTIASGGQNSPPIKINIGRKLPIVVNVVETRCRPDPSTAEPHHADHSGD